MKTKKDKPVTQPQIDELLRLAAYPGACWTFSSPTLRVLIKAGLVEDSGHRRQKLKSMTVSKTSERLNYAEQSMVQVALKGRELVGTLQIQAILEDG